VSPFSPDCNHIHHHLFRLGLSHLQITVLILAYTILITTAAILLSDLNINISFMLFFSVSVVVLNIPTLLLKRRNKLGTITKFID